MILKIIFFYFESFMLITVVPLKQLINDNGEFGSAAYANILDDIYMMPKENFIRKLKL